MAPHLDDDDVNKAYKIVLQYFPYRVRVELAAFDAYEWVIVHYRRRARCYFRASELMISTAQSTWTNAQQGNTMAYYFKHPVDAVVFKLRWGRVILPL